MKLTSPYFALRGDQFLTNFAQLGQKMWKEGVERNLRQ
jgi:hypothetical protein